MNLKKSDKIIAVVGVIILIIAGISIAIMTTSKEETPEEEVGLELETFYVTWTKETGQTGIDDKAEKVKKGHFDEALKNVRASITPDIVRFYDKMSENLGTGISKKDIENRELEVA